MPEGRDFDPDDQSPALAPRRSERSPTVHQRKRAERVLRVHGNPFGDELPDPPPLGNQPDPQFFKLTYETIGGRPQQTAILARRSTKYRLDQPNG